MMSMASAAKFGDFTYSDDGVKIPITGYSKTAIGPATIPASINGRPVAIIDSSAFASCTELTSVSIPSTVYSIKATVFKRAGKLSSITVDAGNSSYSSQNGILFNKQKTSLLACPAKKSGSYSIPSTVSNLWSYAFFGCDSLTGITIPPSVTVIGNGIFQKCGSLAGIVIPESVTSIGMSAFQDCISMRNVTIPAGIATINSNAFDDCRSMTALEIPSGLSTISGNAFRDCSGLTQLDISQGVTSITCWIDTRLEHNQVFTVWTLDESVPVAPPARESIRRIIGNLDLLGLSESETAALRQKIEKRIALDPTAAPQ